MGARACRDRVIASVSSASISPLSPGVAAEQEQIVRDRSCVCGEVEDLRGGAQTDGGRDLGALDIGRRHRHFTTLRSDVRHCGSGRLLLHGGPGQREEG